MPSAGVTKTAPEAAKPEGAKAADPHAGHSSGHPAEQQKDPVNGLMVDPAKAPKTTYEGQTYYFSSEQSRKAFLSNPGKFAKKPKG
jgi:YHS domain-containing protein